MLRFWALLFLVAPLPTVWSWAGTSVASLSSRRQHRVTRSAAAASWEIPGGGLGSVNRFFNSVKNFSRARRKPVNSKDAAVDSSSTRVHTGTDAEVASVRDKGNWKALGELASADKGLLFVSSLSLVMAALCDAGLPKYSAAALSSIVASDTAGFAAAMKGFLLLSAGSAIFTGLRGGFFSVAGATVVARLRLKLFQNLLRQEISFFDSHPTGELTSRLTGDASKLSNVVSYHANIIVRQSIQTVGGLAYLFYLNGKMAAAATAGLLMMGVISHVNGAYSRWLAAKITDETADANAVAEQALGLVRLVRAHAAEDVEVAKYSNKLGNIMALEEAQGYGYGLGRSLSAVASCAVTLAVLLTGQRAVVSGALTGEGVTAFFLYVAFVAGSSFDVGEQWTRIQQALGAGKSVFAMASREPERIPRALSTSPEVPGTSAVAAAQKVPNLKDTTRSQIEAEETRATTNTTTALPVDLQQGDVVLESASSDADTPKLELKDVHFEYPGRKGAPVLQGLNLAVKPGEVVGLVGGSGGGKSTVIRLVCGFYAAQRGSVTLNGKDVLREYTPEELARTIAWVTQEPQLFPVSVAENIAYGLPEGSWTMDDVERCAKLANAHNFVRALPKGYATPVGENGGSLSGGQRQRVAIARALMRDPEVLLLDEPTSALDAESEALVQAALRNAFAGRTVVIVAHRLSTVASADRVVVLANGKVAEQGKPEELGSRPGGLYAALLKSQVPTFT